MKADDLEPALPVQLDHVVEVVPGHRLGVLGVDCPDVPAAILEAMKLQRHRRVL